MILIDTREKRIEHIERYFTDNNVEYSLQKLDTGDYMNTEYPEIIIDRKQNLDECAHNLNSADSSRFWRELRRAHEEKVKLVFLVEHGGRIKCFDDVLSWTSRYSARITGRRVANEMFKAHVAYGVDWKFCRKQDTAKRILEILQYDSRGDKAGNINAGSGEALRDTDP